MQGAVGKLVPLVPQAAAAAGKERKGEKRSEEKRAVYSNLEKAK